MKEWWLSEKCPSLQQLRLPWSDRCAAVFILIILLVFFYLNSCNSEKKGRVFTYLIISFFQIFSTAFGLNSSDIILKVLICPHVRDACMFRNAWRTYLGLQNTVSTLSTETSLGLENVFCVFADEELQRLPDPSEQLNPCEQQANVRSLFFLFSADCMY